MDDRKHEKKADAAARLLKLAEELGNVSAACRSLGLDRSVYYRSRKVTRKGGECKAAAASVGPGRTLDGEAVGRILHLCLEFPDWGCDRIAYYLVLKGHSVSSPTVQKILIRHGLGRMGERMEAAGRRVPGADSNQVSP